MGTHFKAPRIAGVPPPADAGDIIGFSVRAVHRQQNVRDLPAQRRLSVNRFLADVSVQIDLVGPGAFLQFLKGRGLQESLYQKRLEPEIKLFRFEKSDCDFFELSEEKRKEEVHNIRNGLNFAKKVLTTGECDLLILDEVLELTGNSLIEEEDLKNVLEARGEYTDVILTGTQAPEGIRAMADAISEIHRAR